jgi:hypothetical protein
VLRNTTTQKPGERITQILMIFGRNVKMQERPSEHRDTPHCRQSRLILRASIGESAQKIILATLALKEDTIPKPDGLAMVTEFADIELNSDKVEQCSNMIEDYSHYVRGSM